MALGASASRIQLSVLAQTLRLTLIGIAIGSVASFVAGKAIAALLFSTEPTDPVIFTAMMFLLASVALIAGHIPARRASRIDPMAVLRGS
jgi:ABC-type antimicrobial peptide transport system permease subunit